MGSLNYWIRLICFCLFDSHSAELHFSHLHLQVAGWHMKEVEWKRQVKEWHERMNEFEKRESELNERLYRLKEVGLINIHVVISIFLGIGFHLALVGIMASDTSWVTYEVLLSCSMGIH